LILLHQLKNYSSVTFNDKTNRNYSHLLYNVMHQFLMMPQYFDQTMKTKNYVQHYRVLYESNGNRLILKKVQIQLQLRLYP
jgi:hypothetical protein